MPGERLEPFLDVEAAIKEWGMLSCERSAKTRKQKKMFKRQFVNDEVVMDVQIDWSHLSVSHSTVWGDIVDGDFRKSNASRPAQGTTVSKALKPSDVQGSDVNVLFQTDFKNDSEKDQQFTLKIEKTTNSACSTSIEHGVTNGVELCATLSVGDILEVGAGFSHEESLHKMEGETIERQVTWAAESAVVVPKHRSATAEMEVIEKQQSGDFTVFTQMTGYIIVKYISMKDNKLTFGHSGKIDTIIKDYVREMQKRNKKFVGVEYPGDSKVLFETKGKCSFRYGIKQIVTIVQDPSPTK